jgi:glycosyltransferase involved in cell wall biosynthesis
VAVKRDSMRLLILSNMYPSADKPYAGIFVKNQVEVLRELAAKGWRIDLLAMPRRFTGPLGSAMKYLGFSLRCIPAMFRRYEVVHIHFFVPLGFLGALYKWLHPSAKVVVTFHGGDVASRHFKGLCGRFWRAISKKVDLGIAVGSGVSAAVTRYLSVQQLVLLPAGVDNRKFFPPQAPPEKKYDLVFAGSFIPRKGLDLLVEALQKQAFRTVRLACVGTGPLASLLLTLSEKRDVTVLGHLTQDEMRQTYWSSRFLVLPSRSEPFGLVVSEALFSGIPAIVSDEPGPAMQVRDGVNGLVCCRNSVPSLETALLRALAIDTQEYKLMAQAAAQSNQGFGIYQVARELLRQYQGLVAE